MTASHPSNPSFVPGRDREGVHSRTATRAITARWRLALAGALCALLAACDAGTSEGHRWHGRGEVPASHPATDRIEVPPPPFSDGVFPCSNCHEAGMPVNTRKRKMKITHEEIVLHHDEENRWCLDCHSATDRDKLHLANGELIDFTESYKLCGQCHGDKYRDWRAGVHGRRTGSWNGPKMYLLCVHCHNAHSPAFKPIAPLPVPRRPGRTN